MEIHTFRAASLQEALLLVRHELGPDASVLQTRQVSGKLFGLLGKRCVEVYASRDAHVIRRLPGSVAAEGDDAGDREADAPTTRQSNRPASRPAASAGFDLTEPDASFEAASLSLGMSDLDQAVETSASASASTIVAGPAVAGTATAVRRRRSITNNPGTVEEAADPTTSRSSLHAHASHAAGSPVNYLSPAMFEVFTEMLDADVDPDAARTMLQEVSAHCTPEHLNDAWLIKGRLCQFIQQQVNVSGPIELTRGNRQVVALVGPTGVGKTTTLAKLAAGFHFDQGCSVGFVTLDTFRLGAVDQLQKYADLLGAPCEVVSAPDQMLPALQRLEHCQLILIDTAGRSPRDQSQLGALSDFLQIASPTQIHLVLSAASSQSHAALALEQFAALDPTHLLLTKLDESPCLGGWYRLLSSGTWPLSYITTGQHVPEDIIVANRRRVASLILGQTNHLTWK